MAKEALPQDRPISLGWFLEVVVVRVALLEVSLDLRAPMAAGLSFWVLPGSLEQERFPPRGITDSTLAVVWITRCRALVAQVGAPAAPFSFAARRPLYQAAA